MAELIRHEDTGPYSRFWQKEQGRIKRFDEDHPYATKTANALSRILKSNTSLKPEETSDTNGGTYNSTRRLSAIVDGASFVIEFIENGSSSNYMRITIGGTSIKLPLLYTGDPSRCRVVNDFEDAFTSARDREASEVLSALEAIAGGHN